MSRACALCGHNPACGPTRLGGNLLCRTGEHPCYEMWKDLGYRPGHPAGWKAWLRFGLKKAAWGVVIGLVLGAIVAWVFLLVVVAISYVR